MVQNEFLDKIHKRLSTVSVGASALRNQGASGMVEIARTYFYESIVIAEFFASLANSNKFISFLDFHTENLLQKFPEKGKSWGAARKALNLFFRELVYNKFISDYFKLPTDISEVNNIIKHLEVPLDKEVATGIFQASNGTIPRWESIKKLQRERSEIYQKVALEIAENKQIARIHLDLLFWRP